MYHIQTKLRKNSKQFKKTIFETESEKEIKKYMEENNLKVTGKPYFFTHIELNNYEAILTCSVRGIICSPTELYKSLTE